MQVTELADMRFLTKKEAVRVLLKDPNAEIYDAQGFRLVLTKSKRAVRSVPNELDRKEPPNFSFAVDGSKAYIYK